jgi:hypothetical protein
MTEGSGINYPIPNELILKKRITSFGTLRAIDPSRMGSHPEYWPMLTGDDQKLYLELRGFLQSLLLRTTPGHISQKFHILMLHIQNYAIRGDGSDWKRQLVCGILWMQNALAINTRQLSKLLGKCKSSINCGLQANGWEHTAATAADTLEISRVFPFLTSGGDEIRQWTVRVPRGARVRLSARARRPREKKAIVYELEECVDWLRESEFNQDQWDDGEDVG